MKLSKIILSFLLIIQLLTPLSSTHASGAPEITGISPKTVRIEGGTEIIVRGKNFSRDSLIVFGGSIITNASISPTEIRFRAPAQKSPGGVKLSVKTPDGLAQRELTIISRPFSDLKDGEITTIAGGNIFIGDGKKAIKAALPSPFDIAIDRQGNIFISDGNTIRRIDAKTGIINTIAGNGVRGFSGDGGPAIIASIAPSDLAVDSAGNLFIAELENRRIRQINSVTGIITTISGNGSEESSGDGGPASNAGLIPGSIAIDEANNLFITDNVFSSPRVRRIDAATGIITTVAGNGETGFGGIGDGGPAIDAGLSPGSIALDRNGNLFILESDRIRQVDARTGIINTVAGGNSVDPGDGVPAKDALFLADDIAIDKIGNLFISDRNQRVRQIDARTGIIRTVAGNGEPGFSGDGGPAINAKISLRNIALDEAGNLYIPTINRLRKVDARTNIITTVAGNGENGLVNDGRTAIGALIYSSTGVAVDEAGNLFIVDSFGNRIRRVDAKTGIISTFAGNGMAGFGGDGGPATQASLNLSPFIQDQIYFSGGITVDGAGNLSQLVRNY